MCRIIPANLRFPLSVLLFFLIIPASYFQTEKHRICTGKHAITPSLFIHALFIGICALFPYFSGIVRPVSLHKSRINLYVLNNTTVTPFFCLAIPSACPAIPPPLRRSCALCGDLWTTGGGSAALTTVCVPLWPVLRSLQPVRRSLRPCGDPVPFPVQIRQNPHCPMSIKPFFHIAKTEKRIHAATCTRRCLLLKTQTTLFSVNPAPLYPALYPLHDRT